MFTSATLTGSLVQLRKVANANFAGEDRRKRRDALAGAAYSYRDGYSQTELALVVKRYFLALVAGAVRRP